MSEEIGRAEHISELEFGYEMLVWDGKNTYPLEAVSVRIYEDADGEFYSPSIQKYTGDGSQWYVTGNPDGYETREQTMRCVGRCWDKALKDRAERIAAYEAWKKNPVGEPPQ